ncbi:hypothetical protein FEM48_Zijuj07G0011500 [Ziziphus jujuba var. spinosa]|uniref:Uncharacterized protein n=1 Tax=Ziziphus jujuba var. spinosa TaxID=714518 RepID=A0A978V1K1_ZIZJJ|nr:hypothetical protein FEM48_Zijuj07G0011500 [Ziziphus jujuba var. spinosa]
MISQDFVFVIVDDPKSSLSPIFLLSQPDSMVAIGVGAAVSILLHLLHFLQLAHRRSKSCSQKVIPFSTISYSNEDEVTAVSLDESMADYTAKKSQILHLGWDNHRQVIWWNH